jgi:N-carbamoyl-L-amino-acid hydrolase
MAEAGLAAAIDRVGNVYGRTPGNRRTVLIGSHTDSVPNGGWLDGALGVMYGLEIARAMIEAGHAGGVDVISFQDEEGTFLPCLGSKSYCGVLSNDDLARAAGPDERRLSDVLAAAGFSAEASRFEPDRQVAYLEAHIEQGPKLEAAGARIGIVTGIVGIRRFRVRASGQADHAGTTPMRLRKDAGAALIRLAARILESMPAMSAGETVWNIGAMEFKPGAANVVPAEASFILEIRDLDEKVLDRLQTRVEAMVAEAAAGAPVAVAHESIGRIEAVAMDRALADIVRKVAARHVGEPMIMPSGAGHDAMVVARTMPSAMLFIPSIGGRSHNIVEDTREDDIVLGCRVLADAVNEVLSRAGSTDRPGR